MKLYFAAGTCALSPHIVLNELGLPYELVPVDLKARKTADGRDFLAINPKGYVPALELDDGQYLTEGPVIIQYLADCKPESRLIPAPGSIERIRLQEWLNFISSEIHKNFSALFNKALPDAARAIFKDKVAERLAFVGRHLEPRDFLLGPRFSVADAYLFAVARWSPQFGIDLGRWPALARFMERVGTRPAVKSAVSAEDASKKAA